jgi:hypothetical protein
MARSWEAEFMELWRTGVDTAEIARQLGIPQGTVSSRAHTLQRQGKIQPRPRGGAHSRRVAQARQEPPPVQSSAEQGGAEQSGAALVPSPAVSSAAIIDLLRQTLARLDTVEHDLKALREDRPPGAGQSSAVQSSAEPPALAPEDAKAERWNLWVPRGLRRQIEARAQARGVAPSRVVQELLWQALNDQHTSPP